MFIIKHTIIAQHIKPYHSNSDAPAYGLSKRCGIRIEWPGTDG